MSGFGTLYYTDCRPGQGLQGTAGFQFQAASPGLATEAMGVVAQAALYEAPGAWMRDQRDVADYPCSLAHIADGDLIVTAAGRYLGKEANGNREGNQFTHAVVTRNGADYGLVRPAQLWAAPWWTGEPAPHTELEPLPAPPLTGPLDTETVRDRVRADPDGEAQLVALLSAVHQLAAPSTRRGIVIVTSDPEQAACWIAAATMLVPSQEALRTTFKIFVADAQYSQHDIIAVHPEWAGRWADTGPSTGLAVFDLERGQRSAVEPTEQAKFWVPRFLREDAYDIVDAVELAGQFGAGRGPGSPPGYADRVVALVLSAGAPLSSAEEVRAAAGWLRTAPEEAVAMARDLVVDAVLGSRPGGPVLRTLADAAGTRGWDIVTGIHRGLLAAELDEVVGAEDGAAALRELQGHPPLLHRGRPASESERRHDRESVENALRAAPPEQVPALLWLTRRHRLDRRWEQFPDTGRRFVSWWLTCPEPAFAPRRWSPVSDELLPWAREELRSWLATDGEPAARAVTAVQQRWWTPLWRDADRPHEKLDQLLINSAYPHVEPSDQISLIRIVLQAFGDTPPYGVHPTSMAWQVLFADRLPGVAEVVAFVEGLTRFGMWVAPDVAPRLCAVLDAEPGVSAATLAIAEKIRSDGQELSPRQRQRLEQRDRIRHFTAVLVAAQAPPAGLDVPDELNRTEPGVLVTMASGLVDALIDAPPQRAVAVVCGCRRGTLAPVYHQLERRWPKRTAVVTEREAAAAAFTFELVHATPGDAEQKHDFDVLRNRLGGIVGAMPKPDQVRIERAGRLGERWWQWVATVEPKRWSLSRLSRPGRHPSKGS